MSVTGTEVVLCLRMDTGGDGKEEDGGDGVSAVHDWSTSHFSMQQRLLKSEIIRTQDLAFELAKNYNLLPSVWQCICQDKHLNKHKCDVSLTDDQSSDQIGINPVSVMFVCLPLENINIVFYAHSGVGGGIL